MAVLENVKWENFAQGLAQGKSADQAYQDAGYSANRGNAVRLKTNESIVARVQELQQVAVRRHDITLDTLTDELEAARLSAMDGSRESAAISATMGKAKLHGLDVQRLEHSGPYGDAVKVDVNVTDLELARRIGFVLAKGSDAADP